MRKFKVHASNQANCVRLAGNVAAGILLYRMFVRAGKSTMEDRSGESGWAVLTPNEWILDTGLTINQYNKGLRRLKDLRLIIYKNQQLGKRSGAPPLWVKLTRDIQEIIRGDRLPLGDWISCREAIKEGGNQLPEGTPYIEYVNKNKSVKVMCNQTSLDSKKENDSNIIILGDKRMKKGVGKGRDIIKGKKVKSVQDAISKHTLKKRSDKITGVQSFEFMWIQLHAEHYDDTIEKWTGKEQGYAKSIITKANVRKKFDLVKVITAVIANWEDYADYAATQRGLDKGPNYPNIGYLAAGFQDLVYWYKEHTTVHTSAKDDGAWLTLEQSMAEENE